MKGEEGKRVVTHGGNVDVRYGIYRLQADKIVIYEAENKIVAEGSVVFDQGDDQRITGARGGIIKRSWAFSKNRPGLPTRRTTAR